MSRKTFHILIWVIGVVAALFLIFAFFAPWILLQPSLTPHTDYSKGGEIGKAVGGLMAPFIAIGAALLTFIAFLVQYHANQKIQDQFKIQQFENQFYKMLDLHKSNVTEIIIPFFDILSGTSSSRTYKQVDTKISNTILREVSGKKGFVDMVKELEICIEDAHSILKSQNPDYINDAINEFAYKIFFWGVNSDFVQSNQIEKVHQQIVIRLLKKKQNDYHSNLKSGQKQTVNTRYVPFQGHESRLAHYYRHLFHTVKYVVETENSNLINYNNARQYLRILRAQLSNAEQLMLYYNYICGFGIEWDKKGKRGNQYLTKYRMIHNMPVDRVQSVENPREHFKDFILSFCDENNTLFEWGDK